MTAEIIIVTYGQPEMERRSIDAVRKYTDLDRHKLTVIDNFTRDANLAKVWNEAIAASDREYVCLLNSDAIVEPEWLEKMIGVSVTHGADAVGPMSDRVGTAAQKGTRGNGVVKVEHLSGFCLLLRRAAWADSRGFREDHTFYGQESNLMRRLGKKLVACNVFVHHAGGASLAPTGRGGDERAMRNEFWSRYMKFNWRMRLAILGLGPGVPGPLWRGIDEAVNEMQREGMAAQHFNLSEVSGRELAQWKPDAVIVCSGSKIERAAEALRFTRAPKGLWFNDLRNADESAFKFRDVFSRLFLCFGHAREYSHRKWAEIARARAHYMPQGSRVHPELAPLEIKRRVVFIGDTENERFHSGRQEICKALGAEIFNARPGEERRAIEAASRETYRQSMFCLSMSPPISGYTSLRLYNILAYGGLALVRRFPGCERLFEHKKHVLFFSEIDEARRLMDEYSQKPEECERIRKRGWRYQQAKHTAMMRLMNMASCLTGPDESFWGWCDQ